MKKIPLLLCLLITFLPVFAQQDAPKPSPEVTFYYGLVYGGSGHTIAKHMAENGFGEDLNYSSYIRVKNPLREESAYQFSVLYPIKNNFRIKGLLHYRKTDVKGSAASYQPATVNTSVFTAAMIAFVPLPTQQLRLGAGPAYHSAKATMITSSNKMNFSKLGLVLESGISIPAHSQFFVDLQMQYFYVGKEDLGSYTLYGTDNAGKPSSTMIEFSDTSFSSFIFSIGVGLRLNKI